MSETLLVVPLHLEVKNFLRENENDFFDKMQQLGGQVNRGRGVLLISYNHPVSSKFTGLKMCLYGSTLLKEMLDQQFPQNPTYLVTGKITPIDTTTEEPEIEHYWIKTEVGGESFFVDGTYGQRHPFLNRIVFDRSANEAFYYGFNHRSYKTRASYTSEEIAERWRENRPVILTV